MEPDATKLTQKRSQPNAKSNKADAETEQADAETERIQMVYYGTVGSFPVLGYESVVSSSA
jgi:hypothetical protein